MSGLEHQLPAGKAYFQYNPGKLTLIGGKEQATKRIARMSVELMRRTGARVRIALWGRDRKDKPVAHVVGV